MSFFVITEIEEIIIRLLLIFIALKFLQIMDIYIKNH